MSAEHGDVWRSACGMMELRCGDYREVLADVEPDHVISDPPYGARTHNGQRHGRRLTGAGNPSETRQLEYTSWSEGDVAAFLARWAEVGWIFALTSDDLASVYRQHAESLARTTFAPIACVQPGMNVRLAGDGPSNWTVYGCPSRLRSMRAWGTLPGAYVVSRGGQSDRAARAVSGGKPVGLMRQIVRDYSRPGDLICDPCAGGGTTLLAAAIEGRRAVGAELDPATFEKAVKRLSKPYTPATLFRPGDTTGEQTGLDL